MDLRIDFLTRLFFGFALIGDRVDFCSDDVRIADVFLGNDVNAGEHAMVVIPKGAIFAAENLVRDGFTFVSCVTTPNFTYEGFRLVNKDEIRADYPEYADEVEYLAYVTL